MSSTVAEKEVSLAVTVCSVFQCFSYSASAVTGLSAYLPQTNTTISHYQTRPNQSFNAFFSYVLFSDADLKRCPTFAVSSPLRARMLLPSVTSPGKLVLVVFLLAAGAISADVEPAQKPVSAKCDRRTSVRR